MFKYNKFLTFPFYLHSIVLNVFFLVCVHQFPPSFFQNAIILHNHIKQTNHIHLHMWTFTNTKCVNVKCASLNSGDNTPYHPNHYIQFPPTSNLKILYSPKRMPTWFCSQREKFHLCKNVNSPSWNINTFTSPITL